VILPIIGAGIGLGLKYGVPIAGGVISYGERKKRGQTDAQALAGASAEAAAGALIFPGISALGNLGKGAYYARNAGAALKAAKAAEQSAKVAKATRLAFKARTAGSVLTGVAKGTAKAGRTVAIGSIGSGLGGAAFDATQAPAQNPADYPALPKYDGYPMPVNPGDGPGGPSFGTSKNYLFATAAGVGLAAGGYALNRKLKPPAPLAPRQPTVINVPQVDLGQVANSAGKKSKGLLAGAGRLAARAVAGFGQVLVSKEAERAMKVGTDALKVAASVNKVNATVNPKRGIPNPDAVAPAVQELVKNADKFKTRAQKLARGETLAPTPRDLRRIADLPVSGPLSAPTRVNPAIAPPVSTPGKSPAKPAGYPGKVRNFKQGSKPPTMMAAVIEYPSDPGGRWNRLPDQVRKFPQDVSSKIRPESVVNPATGPGVNGRANGPKSPSAPAASSPVPRPLTIGQRVTEIVDRYQPKYGAQGIGNRPPLDPEVLRADAARDLRKAQRYRAIEQMRSRGITPMDTYRGPAAPEPLKPAQQPRVQGPVEPAKIQGPMPAKPPTPPKEVRGKARNLRAGNVVVPATQATGPKPIAPVSSKAVTVSGSMSPRVQAQLNTILANFKPTSSDPPGALIRVPQVPQAPKPQSAIQVPRLPVPARTSQRVLVTPASETQRAKYLQRVAQAPKVVNPDARLPGPFPRATGAPLEPTRVTPATRVLPLRTYGPVRPPILTGPMPAVPRSARLFTEPAKASAPAPKAPVSMASRAPIPESRALVPVAQKPQILSAPPSTGGFGTKTSGANTSGTKAPGQSTVGRWIAEGQKIAQQPGPAAQAMSAQARAAEVRAAAARAAGSAKPPAASPPAAAQGRRAPGRVRTGPNAGGRIPPKPPGTPAVAQMPTNPGSQGPKTLATVTGTMTPKTQSTGFEVPSFKVGGFQLTIPPIPRVTKGRVAVVAGVGLAAAGAVGIVRAGMPQQQDQMGTTKGTGPFANFFDKLWGNPGQQDEDNAARTARDLQVQAMRNKTLEQNAATQARARTDAAKIALAGRDPQAYAALNRASAPGEPKRYAGPAFGPGGMKTQDPGSMLESMEAVSTRNQRLRDAAAMARKASDQEVALGIERAKTQGITYKADRELQGTRFKEDGQTARQKISTGGQVQIAQGQAITQRYQADQTLRGVNVRANADVRRQQVQTAGQVAIAGGAQFTQRYQSDNLVRQTGIKTAGDVRQTSIKTAGDVRREEIQASGKVAISRGEQTTKRYQSDNDLRGTMFKSQAEVDRERISSGAKVRVAQVETTGKVQVAGLESGAKRYVSDNELRGTQRKSQADEYVSNQNMFGQTAAAQAEAAGAAQKAALEADPELMMAYGEDEIKAVKRRRALKAAFDSMKYETVSGYGKRG
jgi:hypothetical protein